MQQASTLEILRDRLGHLLDTAGLLDADEAGPRYQQDWSGLHGMPLAVIRPRSTEELAAVMRILNNQQQPVVVQGGMTGLSGGATPRDNEVVVSLERMQHIGEVDSVHGTVLVEAGAILETVQRHVQKQGWFFPVDIGSRGSCQIGGMVSTNAGGNRVLRWGMTRASVRGLEVVLADGRILSRLAPMLKDNAGYDLRHLFIGSEGTLGIITRVLLELVPQPTSSQTALVSLENLEQVQSLLHLCRKGLGGRLSSFEVMWRDYFDTASALTSPGSPVLHNPGALLVLVEALGSDIDADAAHFEACMAEALSLGDGVDAVIAQSLADAQKLWALREASGESAKTIAPWVGFDVSVPLQAMARLVDAVRQGVHALDSQLSTQTYGHLGDGNLHFVVGPLHEEAPSSAVKHLVHRTAGLLGGSVSGEHGIGVLKKLYLGMTRSPDEIEVMRALKSTLDPLGLLNRDRVFDCTPP